MMKGLGLVVFSVIALATASKYQPCSDLDFECITDYLAKISGCTPVEERANTYTKSNFWVVTPFVNMTILKVEQSAVGLFNSSVTNFYIDETSESTVLELYHPYLIIEGLEDAKLHSIGNFDFDIVYNFSVIIEDTYTRTVWKGVDTIDLNSGTTYSQIYTIPYYPLVGDALVAYNTNELAHEIISLVSNRTDVFAREEILYFGRQFAEGFIDKILCAFL